MIYVWMIWKTHIDTEMPTTKGNCPQWFLFSLKGKIIPNKFKNIDYKYI